MITENEQKVYGTLHELGIPFVRYEHSPVFTVEETKTLGLEIPGQHCKNLFIRNKKGDAHYLVVLDDSKKVNLKDLSAQVGSSGLSLASEERLYTHLGLTPGAVGPFGLINNKEKNVIVLLDKDIVNSETICFHPNVNTATISIKYKDFEKYLDWCKNEVQYVQI